MRDVTIGVISDTHWKDTRSRKEKIDRFIDTMNNDVVPDFCIHLGDIASGAAETPEDPVDESTMVTRVEQCVDYIENKGGEQNEGLDTPIHYILGNHEYKGASSWAMQKIYRSIGWDGLEDSWCSIDRGDWRLLCLNTFYTEADVDDCPRFRIPDASDGADELGWIRDRIRGTRSNVLAVTHQPLTNLTDYIVDDHDLHTFYFYPKHGLEVAKLLSKQPNTLNVHGHLHHNWSASQTRLNQFGTPELFVNHNAVGEFGTLWLSGSDWRFSPRNSDYSTMATDLSLYTRENDLRGVRSDAMEYEFQFESVDGFDGSETTLAAEAIATPSGAMLKTGDKAGERAAIERRLRHPIEDVTHPLAKPTLVERKFTIEIDIDGISGGLTGDFTVGSPSTRFGFEIADDHLCGISSDGTDEKRVSLYEPIGSIDRTLHLGAYYDGFNLGTNDEIHFFENGRQLGSIDTCLPTTIDGADTIDLSIENTNDVSNTIYINTVSITQPRVIFED